MTTRLTNQTLKLLAASLFLLAGGSVSVDAFCPCSGSISAHRSSTNSNRDANTDRTIENFNTTIGASTGQITGYMDKLLTGFEKLTDSQSMNDAMRARQEIRAGAESHRYDPALTSCQGLRAAVLLVESVDPATGIGPGAKTTRRSHAYENCADQEQTVCQGVQEVARQSITDQQVLGGTAGWPDPTTDIRLLLGDPTMGLRSTTSLEELERASWRLRQNIVNPFPERPPTADQRLQVGGDVELASFLSDTARRSVATRVFELVEGESFPTIDLTDAHLASLIGDNPPLPSGTSTISRRHLYELFVNGGYGNPEWHVRLAAASPEAVAREMVMQVALANDLAWQKLELDRHRALVEATTLAFMLDMDRGEASSGN